jgi:hypothetical protein
MYALFDMSSSLASADSILRGVSAAFWLSCFNDQGKSVNPEHALWATCLFTLTEGCVGILGLQRAQQANKVDTVSAILPS